MSINKLFDSIEKTREAANWRAAFGEPQEVEGKTLIPVAQAGYGFGLGFGRNAPSPEAVEGDEHEEDEGGGGGGGGFSKPLGTIVVSAEGVSYQPIENENRVALAGIAFGALFIFEVARTLRALFARD